MKNLSARIRIIIINIFCSLFCNVDGYYVQVFGIFKNSYEKYWDYMEMEDDLNVIAWNWFVDVFDFVLHLID